MVSANFYCATVFNMLKYLGLKKKRIEKRASVTVYCAQHSIITKHYHELRTAIPNSETTSDRQIPITPSVFGQQTTIDEI